MDLWNIYLKPSVIINLNDLCHYSLVSYSRDLSVDAGLPPHQYHIHPLPQHYQHYLTSPRMHHFPRNNASTQVVRTMFL